MINKTNWRLANKFLAYRLHVDLLSKSSMKIQDIHIRYLLEWAQDVPFQKAQNIRPTFPQYLLTNRFSDKAGQLSPMYIKKTLATARLFFTWLLDNQSGYSHIKQSWIKTLKIKRLLEVRKNKEYVTLQEILTIASRPVNSILEKRTRASLVFLYLSGMRISAFISLPIQAVDLSNRCVYQFPDLGVRTKNNKSAVTFLLNIPELLQVVQEWDDEIRSILPANGLWFAPLSPETGLINSASVEAGEHRHAIARRNFKQWLKQQKLPYHSPHKFRHGHIHYGLDNSENIADYKAVSMNVMHSNMEVTDTFYSVLQDDEIKKKNW
ncbi:MAG: tyrosine recombinase XerD [Chloroflexi bacterium OLB14]|nr:MAG: tyrosine recombinase XerD [Chloroflexi bacterium OLB14]